MILHDGHVECSVVQWKICRTSTRNCNLLPHTKANQVPKFLNSYACRSRILSDLRLCSGVLGAGRLLGKLWSLEEFCGGWQTLAGFAAGPCPGPKIQEGKHRKAMEVFHHSPSFRSKLSISVRFETFAYWVRCLTRDTPQFTGFVFPCVPSGCFIINLYQSCLCVLRDLASRVGLPSHASSSGPKRRWPPKITKAVARDWTEVKRMLTVSVGCSPFEDVLRFVTVITSQNPWNTWSWFRNLKFCAGTSLPEWDWKVLWSPQLDQFRHKGCGML